MTIKDLKKLPDDLQIFFIIEGSLDKKFICISTDQAAIIEHEGEKIIVLDTNLKREINLN